jgi:hypothetical protein
VEELSVSLVTFGGGGVVETAKVIWGKVRGTECVFYFSKQFLGQKLLAGSALQAGALSWWRI